MHAQLAQIAAVPELRISEDEAKDLLGAGQKVLSHYSIATTQKALDWSALAAVAVAVYVPRLTMWGAKRRAKARPAQPSQAPQSDPFASFVTAQQMAAAEQRMASD